MLLARRAPSRPQRGHVVVVLRLSGERWLRDEDGQRGLRGLFSSRTISEWLRRRLALLGWQLAHA